MSRIIDFIRKLVRLHDEGADIARSYLHWLLTWVYAMGVALARCWPVLLMLLLGPAVLTLVPQGREALYVAMQDTDGSLLLGIYIYGTTLLAIGIYPMMLVDNVRAAAADRAWLYAKYTVPQLIAATATYALPLLLRYMTTIELDMDKPGREANAALAGVALFLEFIAVGAVCVPGALMIQDVKTKQAAQVAASLFAIGGASALALFMSDPMSVLTRYLVLVCAILVFNAIFHDAYEFADANRKLLERLVGVLLIFAVIMLWITLRLARMPGELAPGWGPLSIVFIAMLGWLSIAYVFDVVLWWKRDGLNSIHPAAAGMLRFGVFAYVAIRLATGAFGSTKVDTLPVAADTPRTTMAAYLDQWLAGRESQASVAKPYPVFIVAAEGGGIRAAYWTANVLAALHDANPGFAQHVLALSGVSGGSMGTSVYAALADSGNLAPACKVDSRVQACAKQIGSADLLSAPLASMLLSEPFNRITAWIPGADRAAALNQSLENAWLTTMGDDRFIAPFGDYAARGMLILPNATDASTAQRLVITPLDAAKELAGARTLDGRAFNFSTATLLSARFPGLSPAGVYTVDKEEPLRIVDGGYSDNSGTATGAEVLTALTAALDRKELTGRFRPVVIAISNGSEIVEKSFVDTFRTTTLGAALDPVATLDGLRVGASKRYEAALRAQVTAQKGEYLAVRLMHKGFEFPLGWMLSPRTTDDMDGRLQILRTAKDSEFKRVGAVLGRRQ